MLTLFNLSSSFQLTHPIPGEHKWHMLRVPFCEYNMAYLVFKGGSSYSGLSERDLYVCLSMKIKYSKWALCNEWPRVYLQAEHSVVPEQYVSMPCMEDHKDIGAKCFCACFESCACNYSRNRSLTIAGHWNKNRTAIFKLILSYKCEVVWKRFGVNSCTCKFALVEWL